MSELEIVEAFRFDEWGVDCPKCEELIEIGDQSQARQYTEKENPLECDCGYKFLIEWNSVN